MPEFIIILQEPKHQGNVGAVARTMKNFGFNKLYLVNPCELGDVCFKRAKHANDVIQNAIILRTLNDVRKDVDYLVGTSGIVNINDKHHIRNPLTPRDFVEYAKKIDTTVGLLFGREDYGLFEEELLKCDLLVTIPTNKEYPIMNLSHAVSIILYELASAELKIYTKGHKTASDFEREKLFQQFCKFLDTVDYPQHKREHTEILFRRVLGRSTLSKWEFYTLMGVFGRARNKIERIKCKDSEKNS
jgi:TrmH family RNA methyltransferase